MADSGSLPRQSTREVGRAFSTTEDLIAITVRQDEGYAELTVEEAKGDAYVTLHMNPGHVEQLRNACNRALEALGYG